MRAKEDARLALVPRHTWRLSMSHSYLRCPTVRLVPVSLHAGPCSEGCKLRCAICYHSSRSPACRNRGMQDSAPSRGHCISHKRYVRGAIAIMACQRKEQPGNIGCCEHRLLMFLWTCSIPCNPTSRRPSFLSAGPAHLWTRLIIISTRIHQIFRTIVR
jgi:hypothetical protein